MQQNQIVVSALCCFVPLSHIGVAAMEVATLLGTSQHSQSEMMDVGSFG
jgi:hypothetical protein